MELSVYHNILATSTNSNQVFIWDYEYFRFLGIIQVEEDSEPTLISFINGYSIIIVGTNKNMIYLIYFECKDMNIKFKLIGKIVLDNINNNIDLKSSKKFL